MLEQSEFSFRLMTRHVYMYIFPFILFVHNATQIPIYIFCVGVVFWNIYPDNYSAVLFKG